MRVRLIRIQSGKFGKHVERSATLDVPELTVGRGTDNHVVVHDPTAALHHAAFIPNPDGIHLVSRSNVKIFLHRHGGEPRDAVRPVESEPVCPGDSVTIGSWTLEIGVPEPGIDLAVELKAPRAEQLPVPDHGPGPRYTRVINLSAVGLALLLLIGALVVPLLARTRDVNPVPFPGAFPAIVASMEAWNVGPLSRSHAQVADCPECCSAPAECTGAKPMARFNTCERCRSCHAAVFREVADEQCVSCHESVGAHGGESATRKLLQRDDMRCRACHTEHQGDQGLIRSDDRLCTGCHSDLRSTGIDTRLLPVPDLRGHPPFRASAPEPLEAAHTAGGELSRLPPSGIEFQHSTHMRPLKMPDGTEKTLQCGACHVLRGRGDVMSMPTFERDCRSCHPLSFGGARDAPHDVWSAVRIAVRESVGAKAFEDARAALACSTRAIPGRQTVAPCPGTGVWVEQHTALALDQLEKACSQCHVGMDLGRADREVDPVHLGPAKAEKRLMARARFDHRAHGEAGCEDCHREVRSTVVSSGRMFPTMDKCRECHAGGGARGRVASGCLFCHDFHDPAHGTMAEAVAARR